jgi:hypothetical protein
MNDNKTSSMLQRLPVILAVTAASYGLQLPVNASRPAGVTKAQSSKGVPTAAVARKNVRA